MFEAGLDSFVNEARLLAQFDHPSLLKVYRFWQANDTACMVMPFYGGVTLKDRLRWLGAPPDERSLMAFLASLTEALAVIHVVHCLHRDIAPDNILMLADSGRPLLLDFGAERQEIGDATQALTPIPKRGCAPVEQYAEVPSLMQGPWTDVPVRCAVIDGAVMGAKPPVSVGRTVWPPMPPPAARWRPPEIRSDEKKPPEGGFFFRREPNYLLAAFAAAPAAAEAAASATEVAAPAAAEAAESITAEAAAVTAGAAAADGGATGATISSFLPQAVKAAAAIRVANRSDLFICVLSEKCRSTLPVTGSDPFSKTIRSNQCVQKPDPES